MRQTAYGKYQSLPRQYLSRAPCDHHKPKPSQIRTFDYVLFYLDHRTMVRSMTTASVRGLKWIHSLREIYIYIYTLLSCTKRILRGVGGREWKNAPPPPPPPPHPHAFFLKKNKKKNKTHILFKNRPPPPPSSCPHAGITLFISHQLGLSTKRLVICRPEHNTQHSCE